MNLAEPAYRAWLGLGGNLGDPVANMAAALRLLDARADCRVEAVSSVFKTPPWGKTDQDWFFNACAEIYTDLAPLQLIAACLDIEAQLKRVRAERWGPRLIDIDILLMQDAEGSFVTMAEEKLQLPHPRMLDRAFVLVPLAEIAAAMALQGRNIADWAKASEQAGIEKARTDAGWWKL